MMIGSFVSNHSGAGTGACSPLSRRYAKLKYFHNYYTHCCERLVFAEPLEMRYLSFAGLLAEVSFPKTCALKLLTCDHLAWSNQLFWLHRTESLPLGLFLCHLLCREYGLGSKNCPFVFRLAHFVPEQQT